MNNYAYTTVEDQIKKLKRQKLSIIDEPAAKAKLRLLQHY